MRLRLFSAGIAFIFALALVACGGGGSSASTGGTPASSNSTSSYKPHVRLKCEDSPCGSNPYKNVWHGIYHAVEANFPKETRVVFRATLPSGKPYPADQYTSPAKGYGIRGGVLRTDEYGQLSHFKWAALNENGPVDPPGEYRFEFRFKYHGEVVAAHASLVMKKLP